MLGSVPAHARAVRRLGLDRNPLRRRSDLVQAAARLTALLICLLAVPGAIGAGMAVHSYVAGVTARQAATRIARLVTVVDDPIDLTGRASFGSHRAAVSWTMPDGSPRSATVDVPGNAHRGSSFTLWTTLTGQPTTAPLDRAAPVADALLTVAGVEIAAIALACMSLTLVDGLLDRHRYRRWDVDWLALSAEQRY